MADLFKVPTQNALQYTLDVQLAAGNTTSITLNQSVAGVLQAPGLLVIDRIDSSENKTATKREYISFTGVSGSTVTGLTRGLGGSTDQVHSVGAIVELVSDIVQEQRKYDVFVTEHETYGAHVSLPSISVMRVGKQLNASGASVQIGDLTIGNSMNASGASLIGLIPIRPVWVIPGTLSAASVSVGKPLVMPTSGTWESFSVVLRSAISGASLVVDINKNFTSIFDAGTRPAILGAGTFVSGASLATKAFSKGDIFTVDIDNAGWFGDAIVQLYGR